MMTIIWTAVIILAGIIEAMTANLVSIWFGFGAVAALLSQLAGVAIKPQIVIFLAVTAVALVLTRPAMRKLTAPKSTPTNADRVLGEIVSVTEEINNQNATGAVYVDGKTWSARGLDNQIIPAGSQVRVTSIQGVKLLVQTIKEHAEV